MKIIKVFFYEEDQIVLSAVILWCCTAFSQVAISSNGAAPDANTMLDVKSNSKGVKFPMLPGSERNAINISGADAGNDGI